MAKNENLTPKEAESLDVQIGRYINQAAPERHLQKYGYRPSTARLDEGTPPVLPTVYPTLNEALAIRRWPRGHITELIGGTSCGIHALAMCASYSEQKTTQS